MVGIARLPRLPGASLVSRPAATPFVAGLAAFVPALALYVRTLMPDVGFWDTAEFQAVGPVLGIAHPTGYPTYTLLAWLASVVLQPLGNEALRANLLSALLVAGSAGIVAASVSMLTRRLVIGAAAGLVFALGTRTWAVALRADPHALHVFLVALLLLLLVMWAERERSGRSGDRWLLAAAFVYGVSLGNHALTLLLAPGIALFLLGVAPGLFRRPGLVAACFATLAVTTIALYAYLPIRSVMNPPMDYADPQTWENFRYLVFAEQFRGEFHGLPPMADAVVALARDVFAELGVLAVLAPIGLVVAAIRRQGLFVLLLTWFMLVWFFALSYSNADISRYYIVPMLCAAVLGGFGAGALWDAAERLWRGAPATGPEDDGAGPPQSSRPRVAGVLVPALVAVLLVGPTLGGVPRRLREVDQSRERFARVWLDSVMANLPANAVIVSWWSYSTTLWYGLYVERQRPDVTIFDDSTIVTQGLGDASAVIDSYLGTRPVFLIRLPRDVPAYEQRYKLTPVASIPGGPVYRVDVRLAGAEPHL